MSGGVVWYPSFGTIRFTDLGRVWSSIAEQEFRDEFVIDTGYGCRTSLVYGAYRQVNVRAELMSSPSVAREFEALQNFIASRNHIAVHEEADCYLGGLVVPPAPGAETLQITTQPWAAWGTSPFTTGDVFVLRSPGPRHLREEVVATDWDGSILTLSAGVIFDYTDEPFAWVCRKDFHPFLRLRPGAPPPMVVHDRRVTWMFDFPLEEVPVTEDALTTPFAGPL